MRTRLCDKCNKEIPSKEEFYKIIKTLWVGPTKNRIDSKHIADICKKCFLNVHIKSHEERK